MRLYLQSQVQSLVQVKLPLQIAVARPAIILKLVVADDTETCSGRGSCLQKARRGGRHREASQAAARDET